MKKNFIIPYTLYPFDVMVSIGEEHSDVIKAIEKSGYRLDEEEKEKLVLRGNGKTTMLRKGQTIIRLCNKDADLVAHEIFHAVSFLMDRIGVKLSDDSDEAYAYAIQYLTKEFSKRTKRK